MSEWQPIETAPKDCTQILGFENGDQAVIFWMQLDVNVGRWAVACVHDDQGFYPTHWMPLPPEPESEK